MIAADGTTAAALRIAATAGHPLSADAIVQSLCDRRIPGVVADASGSVAARVAVTAEGLVVVADAGGGLAATPAQPLVDALAAHWHADVVLETPGMLLAGAVGADDGGRSASGSLDVGEQSQAVYVIGGMIPIDPARRLELAPQLEASVSILPTDDVHLLVGHTPVRDFWPPAQRPVVALSRTDSTRTLQVYSTAGLAGAGMRDRMAMRGIPDITAIWTAGWRDVLAGSADVAAVQARLRHAWVVSGSVSSPEHDIVSALAELGAAADALDQLIGLENDDRLTMAIADGLGLPAVVAELVDGRTSIDDLPGTQHIERSRLGRIVWEQVMAPPVGTSLWSRWRRLPHARPRLAASLAALESLVTVALIAMLVAAPPAPPWSTILWVVASVLVVDVVTDVILLHGLRRRRE